MKRAGPNRASRILSDMARALTSLRATSGVDSGAEVGGVAGQQIAPLPMRVNASTIMLDFFAGSALGYPFWILAARLFDPADVGIGSAALSGLRLCMLLALIGIGSAIILLLPRQGEDPSEILSSAFMLAIVTGLIVAVGFTLISGVFLGELRELATSPLYAGTFLALNGIMVITRTFDSTFMALRRADRVFIRSIVQGVLALVALVVLAVITQRDGLLSILGAWVVGLAASVALGYVYLHRALPQLALRIGSSRSKVREITGIGLPNFALRLAMAVPVNIIPIIVVEVLTPSAAAYWYAVWMFAMIAMMVPGAMSTALFAEASNRPELVNASARQGIRFSLMLGIPVALAIGTGAPLGLQLMGEGYAAAGTTPLRIVVIGVLPNAMVAAYIARQRVTGRLREPILFSIGASSLSVVGAIVGGSQFGLNGVAGAWLAAQMVAGLWAGWKIRDLYSDRPAGAASTAPNHAHRPTHIPNQAGAPPAANRGIHR